MVELPTHLVAQVVAVVLLRARHEEARRVRRHRVLARRAVARERLDGDERRDQSLQPRRGVGGRLLNLGEREAALTGGRDRVEDAALEPGEERLRRHEAVRHRVDVDVFSRLHLRARLDLGRERALRRAQARRRRGDRAQRRQRTTHHHRRHSAAEHPRNIAAQRVEGVGAKYDLASPSRAAVVVGGWCAPQYPEQRQFSQSTLTDVSSLRSAAVGLPPHTRSGMRSCCACRRGSGAAVSAACGAFRAVKL